MLRERLRGRSPWGGDTARRRFIGGGRAASFITAYLLLSWNRLGKPPRTMCNVRPFNQLVPRLPAGDLGQRTNNRTTIDDSQAWAGRRHRISVDEALSRFVII